MKTARYFIVDARQLEEFNEFNTLPKAFAAATDIAETGTYIPVVVKVMVEKTPKEFVPSEQIAVEATA